MSTVDDSAVEVTASEPTVDERVVDVAVSDEYITFYLADGRIVSVPMTWSWRLQAATPKQRQHFEISPSGYGVHWPDVDEDLSGRGALRGTPAPRPGSRRDEPAPPMPTWTPGAIKQLRRRLGDTQTQFAERVGVRQATISDWENANQEPSPLAYRLLDLLAREVA